MNKIYLIIFLMILAINPVYSQVYDMSVPLKGKSIANDSLQTEVLKKLYPQTFKLDTTCFDQKIINTQVVHYPYDVVKKNGKYVKGYWKELWTVEYCGRKVQVPITFKINKKNTIFEIEKI